MTKMSRYHLLTAVALGLTTSMLATGCGGQAAAQDMEVTYYYLPG